MSNITFDSEAKLNVTKEDIEWLRLWCEDTNDESMPHVALIGDSITEGYYQIVKEKLQGVAKVDYLATSYSIASDMYMDTVRNFVKDSAYDVVHYNYGLHAFSVDEDTYESRCRQMLQFLSDKTKPIVATTTTVFDETLETEHASWKDKVVARNEKLVAVANEFQAEINDLNAVCKGLALSDRHPDGVHFNESGYIAFAESVVKSVKKLLMRG